MKIESPLEAEMLLWYIHSPNPFPSIDTPACKSLIEKFEKNGIMRYKDDKLIIVQDALECFMNKIREIELPKQVWV
jgi:hypothetical protein